MTAIQLVGRMPISSYGDFGKLPREIRDLIYAEYFSVDAPETLEKYLDQSKSEPLLYVTQPDTGLLRASRALYRETRSVGNLQEF
jgi:hypothetical protein